MSAVHGEHSEQVVDRLRSERRFVELSDRAYDTLERYQASLIIHRVLSDFDRAISEESRNQFILRALRAASEKLPKKSSERSLSLLAIRMITDEGVL